MNFLWHFALFMAGLYVLGAAVGFGAVILVWALEKWEWYKIQRKAGK